VSRRLWAVIIVFGLIILGELLGGCQVKAQSSAEVLPEAPKPKVMDRRFFLAISALAAAKATDGVTTERMLGRGFHELNPLFGRHPSPARVAGTNAAYFAGEVAVAYILKKRFPKRHFWLIEPLLQSADHIRSAVHNEGL